MKELTANNVQRVKVIAICFSEEGAKNLIQTTTNGNAVHKVFVSDLSNKTLLLNIAAAKIIYLLQQNQVKEFY